MRNAIKNILKVSLTNLTFIILAFQCDLLNFSGGSEGGAAVVCGDGICDSIETIASCAADCTAVCGDGTCNGSETTANCAADCTSATCDTSWPPVNATTVTTAITNPLTVVTTGNCTQYLAVYLYSGYYYNLEWDDAFDGTLAYSGDSLITVYDSAGNAISDSNVSPDMDSGWSTFQSFYPASSGMYYIGLDPYSSGIGTTGFRIYDDVTYMIANVYYDMMLTNGNRVLCLSPSLSIPASTMLYIYLDDYYTLASYTGFSEAYIFDNSIVLQDGPFYSDTVAHSFFTPTTGYYYFCVGTYNGLDSYAGTARIMYY